MILNQYISTKRMKNGRFDANGKLQFIFWNYLGVRKPLLGVDHFFHILYLFMKFYIFHSIYFHLYSFDYTKFKGC